MKLGEKANDLIKIRAAITKVEDEFEKVMLLLKAEKAKLQEEKSYDRPFNFDIVDSEYGVLVNK